MVIESGRRLWHFNTTKVETKRYFEPLTTTTALALMAAIGGTAGVGAGIGSLFGGKKQDRNVPDPLAGLRQQLQALAGQVPAQVAKQKEINAARAAQYKTEGQQGIAENIRGERGFGASSLESRLNAELLDKLSKSQSEADLSAENWGIGEQGRLLMGMGGMYPQQTELEQEPNWAANLLGVGANLATQNWMQENQWKNFAKYLYPTSKPLVGGGGSGGIQLEDLLESNLGSRITRLI